MLPAARLCCRPDLPKNATTVYSLRVRRGRPWLWYLPSSIQERTTLRMTLLDVYDFGREGERHTGAVKDHANHWEECESTAPRT